MTLLELTSLCVFLIASYYNDLERDHKRNAKDINDYAVHRWMGEKRSTQVHYQLIQESILKYWTKVQFATPASSNDATTLLDAGCGLGSALMWMEQQQPEWQLEGRTLSEEQHNFIQTRLPKHKFQVELDSYDNLGSAVYDAIYSIEAVIHSTDIANTFQAWSDHLHPEHGVVVLIDDFLMPGADKKDSDVDNFARSWLANSLVTVTELNQIARRVGLELVESRDLLAEYRIVALNYRNQIPSLQPGQNRNHQGWMGSKYRQKITVEGKLGYNLLVFRKIPLPVAPKKQMKK